MFVTTPAVAHITAMTLAPAPLPLGMSKATAPRALVSACAVAPGGIASQAPARAGAVAVATVTAAAQHDLSAAMRAQEQAGWWVHANLGEPKGAGRNRPSEPHCCGTAFIGTV